MIAVLLAIGMIAVYAAASQSRPSPSEALIEICNSPEAYPPASANDKRICRER